jgi:CDP-paratose synthetase
MHNTSHPAPAPMHILLTGASGFLGGHLAAMLRARGHTVTGLRRQLDEEPDPQLAQRCHWVSREAFLADPKSVLPPIDAVIFAGGCYGRRSEPYRDICDGNLRMPLAILETAVQAGVQLFVNSDTALPHDFNAYALSKAQFAEWGRLFARRPGIRFANLHLDHLYGPGDDPSKFTDFIINCCIANKPHVDLTPGEQQRDFIYIEDAAAAIVAVLDAQATGRLQGYNDIPVGSGVATPIREFVTRVKQLSGATTELRFGALPYRPREVMLSVADTHALQALGWRCQTTLEHGLQNTIRSKLS